MTSIVTSDLYCDLILITTIIPPIDVMDDKVHVSLRELFEDEKFVKNMQLLLAPGVEAAVNRAMEQRDAKVAALQQEMSETKENLAAAHEELKATRNKLEQLEDRLEAAEAYSRRNCILISGVPELPEESTDDLVLDVASAAGVTLTQNDLDRSHRLGRQTGSVDRPRAIIAKLLSYNSRQKLYSARKDLSAHRVRDHPVLTPHVIQNIFISDFLTTKGQQLSFICRQLKNRGRVWAAYTTNGAVKIKKTESQPARTIRDIADLEDMFGVEDEDLRVVLSPSNKTAPRDPKRETAATAAPRSTSGGDVPDGPAQTTRKTAATTARKSPALGAPSRRPSRTATNPAKGTQMSAAGSAR